MFGRLHNWMNKRSDQIFHTFVWLLTGMVITWAGTAMLLSGSVNMDCFYDVGEVYDVFEAQIKSSGPGLEYNVQDGTHTVIDDVASKDFLLEDIEKEWNYMYMRISGLSDENTDCTIACHDALRDEVIIWKYRIKNGDNIITLPCDKKINLLRIIFYDQKNCSFSIEKAQFREKLPVFSGKRALVGGSLVFSTYLLLCVLFSMLKRIWRRQFFKWDWYVGINGLQHIYIKCGNELSKPFATWKNQVRSRVRKYLFTFMIVFMQVMFVLGKYENNQYFKYDVLICMIILILVALISVEHPLQLVNWKNRLVGAWMVLWLMAIISDFYVVKRYANIGYVMIFVVGFFFFCWNNMRQPKQMIEDFVGAVEISFLLNAVFCFLFRPYVPQYRYMGSFYNPNMFAIYLLFVLIALVSALKELISVKGKTIVKLRLIVELAVAFNFLWKTQSTTEFISIILVAILFIIVALQYMYKIGNVSKCMLYGLMGCMVFIGVYCVSGVGIRTIPAMINHEVKFTKDVYEVANHDNVFVVEVNAATLDRIRILQKIQSTSMEQLTTRRNWYWIGYSRKFNLLGHANKESLWGAARWPHNGFIAISYRYGIFTIVPYAIMVLLMIYYSFQALCRKRPWGFYLCSISIGGMVLILVENMELPFAWLSWFSFYLMMGYLFGNKRLPKAQ